MNSEQGTVTKIEGDKAWVLVKRSSMCDCCNSRSACVSLGGGKDMESEALNTAGGKVGDRVLLRISSKSLWKISFLFYMVPVIALIAGALAGMKIGEKYSFNPEISSLLFGIFACAVSFLFIKIFSKRFKNNREYMPEVIRIISPNPDEKSDN